MVIRLEHIMEVRRVVSAFAAVTWSWDAAPMSNKSARVRQKPASCSVTACALLHIPHASQGYLSKQLRKRQNRCPSCAGIISSCHLWGLGGGGQLLSPSPAFHVESSPPFSLQTARLAWSSLCQPGRQRLREGSGWQQSRQNSTLQADGRE